MNKKDCTKERNREILRLFRLSDEPNFITFLNNNPEVLEHEETINDNLNDEHFTDRMWTN
jgi:hypothetical protein